MNKKLLNRSLLAGVVALSTLFLSTYALAGDTLSYDRVAFNVAADKDVENDVLSAVLTATQTGQDTAKLADEVNKAITWAMEIAQKETAVERRTLAYTTSPVYSDGKVDGWQVAQSIELKSKDSKALSTLLSQLQERLKVDSISYSISTAVRKSTEEQLITEAIANFKTRATQVQQAMQRAEYRVVRMDIQTGSEMPQPMMMAANVSSDGGSYSARSAPPSLEAGKQKVRVVIMAEIELSLK
ncbi:SIMPL domain-containing protein [Thiolinea disciformis]|uniref:SIMPL domain-containing protein n=1 Tax=Thiolinea disciformis TaxID=125614 RepID=UPI0003787285|nr:SIMPL domain-containing protein [Thiolinea disciformis]